MSAANLRRLLVDAEVPVGSSLTAVRALAAPDSAESAPGAPAGQKHLMLSYAWGCGKDRVVALQKELQAHGIDTWRDETGSSILHAMEGATDDVMATAVEKSHTVVVCVSKLY